MTSQMSAFVSWLTVAIVKYVDQPMHPGQDCSSAWRADRVGDIAMVEPRPFSSQSINIRGEIDAVTIR